jgi:hypothetical protein
VVKKELITDAHIKDKVSIVVLVEIVSVKNGLQQFIVGGVILEIKNGLVKVFYPAEIFGTYPKSEMLVLKLKIKLEGM